MSDTEIISLEPATGAEVWRGPIGDIAATVAEARRGWPSWAAQPLATRIELMRRFANEVRRDHDALANMIARETGKPLWEAMDEVDAVIARVEIAVRGYAERCAQRKLDNGLQGWVAVRHKPHGVMAVISPCHQPALAPIVNILAALIAGNCVVLCPSEQVPATAEMLVAFFHRAGMAPAVIQLLVGKSQHGIDLALHPGIDGVLFSGSLSDGIEINRQLAAWPGKILALEMDGNNPLVVLDSPKIDEVATLIVQSAFAGAGQRSTAARRLIVKSSMVEPVMAAVKAIADRIICGAPFDDPAPYMGPVIDGAAADRLTESFIHLLSHGGRAIKHMVRLRPGLPFVSPAIIDVTQVRDRPDVAVLGPMLQVIQVDDLDAAIIEANRTRFGLAAGLVGGSPQDYARFWANIRAGLVSWNRPTTTDLPAAPFGGTGASGNQRPSGFYAADNCAYPVSSAELEQPRATLGTGFAPESRAISASTDADFPHGLGQPGTESRPDLDLRVA
ncbi:MAG: succinylglutamate-semialdehyde dehydrogenase [Pseudomonadota bacterium]|nr:succinylglutamate-semialdehyde dehydrogenase [Pseudomonadota bacterium]